MYFQKPGQIGPRAKNNRANRAGPVTTKKNIPTKNYEQVFTFMQNSLTKQLCENHQQHCKLCGMFNNGA
jgi:hypothetical protein